MRDGSLENRLTKKGNSQSMEALVKVMKGSLITSYLYSFTKTEHEHTIKDSTLTTSWWANGVLNL